MLEPKTQNQQLADYIKKNLSKGYTVDALKFSLIGQGYGRTAVERSIELATKQLAEEAPKMVEKPQIKYAAVEEVIPEKKPNLFRRILDLLFR